MSKVPVLVLSGFLGSGKTTLLVRMLQEAAAIGLRPAVLMNELGKLDVDGKLIQDSTLDVQVEKLLDGCICCSRKSEIAGSLKQLLARKPDVVFIELTGVANPEEIADALTEPSLIGHVKLKSVITVLDAEHVLEYNSIFASDRELVHTLRRQMEVADLLLLNKIDLVSEKQRRSIEKTIRKWNESSLLLPTSYSRFDLKLVLGDIRPNEPMKPSFSTELRHGSISRAGASTLQMSLREASTEPSAPPKPAAGHTQLGSQSHQHGDHHEHRPSFSRIRTMTLPCDDSRSITQQMIERYLVKWNRQLLRAKGYLTLGETGKGYLLQYAGKRANWQAADFAGQPYLVLIGLDLDEQALEQDWEQLLNRS